MSRRYPTSRAERIELDIARLKNAEFLAKKSPPQEQPMATEHNSLSDFQEGQWWLLELDKMASGGTHDQKRAVAVVRNLLQTARTVAQPTPQALSAPDSERAAMAKTMTAAQVAKLLRQEAVCLRRMNVWQLDRAAELLEAQPAPLAGAADRPNPMSREQIRSVLMAHGYTVKPGQTDLKPYVYEAAEELICLGRELLDAHPTEQPSQDADEGFVGYLCRAWGESDLPVAELVRDLESVGSFMVRQWLGADDAQDYDGTPTLPRLMTEWQDHDWGDLWSAEFEIGGVSVERLHCTIPAARAAQAQGEKGEA